jgi:hypothetical protein
VPERLWLSEHGRYVPTTRLLESDEGLPIRKTEDGTSVTALSKNGIPLALTEQGIVYMNQVGRQGLATLTALDIADGSVRWRAEGIETHKGTILGDTLYYASMQ